MTLGMLSETLYQCDFAAQDFELLDPAHSFLGDLEPFVIFHYLLLAGRSELSSRREQDYRIRATQCAGNSQRDQWVHKYEQGNDRDANQQAGDHAGGWV